VTTIAIVLGCLAIIGIVAIALWRTLTLFELAIDGGHVEIVRGGIPPALMTEIREIVRIGRVERGTIRVVKDAGEARVVCSAEIDDATVQRIRNVMGRFPIAKLRHFAKS
jgi:uncharacterized protein DUF3634